MFIIITTGTTVSASTRVNCKHVILHQYMTFKRQLPGEIYYYNNTIIATLN